jgi:EAL domain-containing protein (putative c-di-GMP-specific phosphodiesterase class I)
VLTQTCQDATGWLQDHPSLPLDLAVNISAYQLLVPGFADEVADVLATTGLAPTSLILEVTENILIEESELALSVVAELRRLGIRVALDDFGTGYSSLSYLHQLPIDILKIDRTLIHHVDQAPRGGAIIAAVTDLAHALNMLVVTEGVETKQQQAVATATGADQAQGYFYARPLPAAGIDSMLASATPGPWHLYGHAAAG